MAHKDKRIDVRVYLEPEEHEYLKTVAAENGISMSELFRTCTLRKCKFNQKKKANKLTLPSKAENKEKSPTPEDIQKRLNEIDSYIQTNKGHIPKVEFYRLKMEQAELQEMLGK